MDTATEAANCLAIPHNEHHRASCCDGGGGRWRRRRRARTLRVLVTERHTVPAWTNVIVTPVILRGGIGCSNDGVSGPAAGQVIG